jgi:hypothetical protein
LANIPAQKNFQPTYQGAKALFAESAKDGTKDISRGIETLEGTSGSTGNLA